MGKGRAGGISGTRGANPPPSVRDNIPKLEQEFPMTPAGWFGRKSDNNTPTRVVESANPEETAERFWELASEGAKTVEQKGPGMKATFDDGSTVFYRESSKSGSPAINIGNPGGGIPKSQKIHFEKGK